MRAGGRAWAQGLRFKLLLGFTLVFTTVFCVLFYLFYLYSTQLALGRVEQDLRDTVTGAAFALDAQAVRGLAQRGRPDGQGGSSDPRYAQILRSLEGVHRVEPRAWPYVYVPGKRTGDITYLADVWSLHDKDKAAQFGQTLESFPSGLQGLKQLTLDLPRGERRSSGLLGLLGLEQRIGYSDGLGVWVSAYAPLKDRSGASVGAVGVDFDASYVDFVQDAVLGYTLRAFGLAFVLLLGLVYLVASGLSRPLNRLSRMAQRVGQGDYAQDFRPFLRRSRDEIVDLAEVFHGMIERVRGREQALEQQVQELKIEIDEAKRTQQVQEIVDSDFFQDLRGKAARLRARSSADKANTPDP